MVGKLVGQYSDSGRVSHFLKSQSKEPGDLKFRESREESRREEPSTGSEERRSAKHL